MTLAAPRNLESPRAAHPSTFWLGRGRPRVATRPRDLVTLFAEWKRFAKYSLLCRALLVGPGPAFLPASLPSGTRAVACGGARGALGSGRSAVREAEGCRRADRDGVCIQTFPFSYAIVANVLTFGTMRALPGLCAAEVEGVFTSVLQLQHSSPPFSPAKAPN